MLIYWHGFFHGFSTDNIYPSSCLVFLLVASFWLFGIFRDGPQDVVFGQPTQRALPRPGQAECAEITVPDQATHSNGA